MAIDQAVIRGVAAQCRARGLQMPEDVELCNRARVHFWDAAGNLVEIGRAQVVWEET